MVCKDPGFAPFTSADQTPRTINWQHGIFGFIILFVVMVAGGGFRLTIPTTTTQDDGYSTCLPPPNFRLIRP